MSKIKAENLAKEVMKYLTEYKEYITDEVKEVSKELGQQAKSDLRATTTGAYQGSWSNYSKGWSLSTKTRRRLY